MLPAVRSLRGFAIASGALDPPAPCADSPLLRQMGGVSQRARSRSFVDDLEARDSGEDAIIGDQGKVVGDRRGRDPEVAVVNLVVERVADEAASCP